MGLTSCFAGLGIPSPFLAQDSGPGGLFPAPITNSCFSSYFPRVSHTSPACWIFLSFKDLLMRKYGPQGLLSPKAGNEGEREVCTYKGLPQVEPRGGRFSSQPLACELLVPWPGIKSTSPALQTWSQPLHHQGSPRTADFNCACARARAHTHTHTHTHSGCGHCHPLLQWI